MAMMKRLSVLTLAVLACMHLDNPLALAWDYTYHRVINEAALASLPTNFPAFVRTPAAADRIGFLSGEPDRWRNVKDLSFSHYSAPDHYLDMEELAIYGLKPDALPVFRYDFAAELIGFRKAHPEKCPPINAEKNEDHTRELIGFLPWAIAENYGKLKSGFSYLKTFEENGGTPEEIANAKGEHHLRDGHDGPFRGRCLAAAAHDSIHHHGWVGANPQQYRTNQSIHSWIDSGYLNKVGGVKRAELTSQAASGAVGGHQRPAGQARRKCSRPPRCSWSRRTSWSSRSTRWTRTASSPARARRVWKAKRSSKRRWPKSAQLLGDIWYSAWQQAPPDTFLKGQLARRQRAARSAEKE